MIDPGTASENLTDRQQLLLPTRLYGRAQELSQLRAGLTAAHQGAPALLLLTGEAGIGKTVLVAELVEEISRMGGVLLAHQAAADAQTIPYATANALVADFVQQLLGREPSQVKIWQERLQSVLAGSVGHFLRIIPQLALLIDAPPDRHSEIGDPQALSAVALQSFFHLLAEKEGPLVISVDDARQVDAESLRLLRSLTDNRKLPLLLILAWRNEPAQALLDDWRNATLVRVSPLTLDDTAAFLADALHTEPAKVRELARLFQAKSHGNPFFVCELLRLLYDQQLVFFDPQQRRWSWQLTQLQAAPLAGTVAEVVRDRLQLLPTAAQEMLKIAALMEEYFTAEHLAMACRQSPDQVEQQLQQALHRGVLHLRTTAGAIAKPYLLRAADQHGSRLQQMSERYIAQSKAETTNRVDGRSHATLLSPPIRQYQFTHEQVRHAAQLLLPSITATTLYGQIGWQLWHGLAPTARQENIFMLVKALNQTSTLTTDWDQRTTVAQANLLAARTALAGAANANAHALALTGIQWIRYHPYQSAIGPLRRDLYLTGAQAAIQLGRFTQANQLLTAIETEATTPLDRMTIIQQRLRLLYFQGEHQAAVESALDALRQLGVRLPRRPGKGHILWALLRTQVALPGKPWERLAKLPPMTDPQSRKALEIMVTATLSAITVDPTLFMLLGLEIIRQTLKHGVHPLSAMGYALYGVLLCGVAGQIDRGYAFGQLALRLAPQIEIKEYYVFVKYFVHAHVNHWKEPIQATLQPVRDLATTGEFEYLVLAAGLYPYLSWFINDMTIGASEQAIAENQGLLENFVDTPVYYRYQLGWQYYQNLLGRVAEPARLIGAVYDERQMLPLHLASNDQTTLFYAACHKVTLAYLFADYAGAIQAAQTAQRHRSGGLGTPLLPVLIFYDSLAQLAIDPGPAGAAARKRLKRVAANQRQMRRWATHSPANCQHRYTLVAAEAARVQGANDKARELYNAAIQQAQAHDNLPELAVAHEVAARFYLGVQQDASAEQHLRQAHRCYTRWGALGKARQMEQHFPQIFAPRPQAESPDP